jgi:cyanate permease
VDYGVRRGLGYIAIGLTPLLVGVLARDVGNGVFQAIGFVGAVLVAAGLFITGKTLLLGED